MIFHTSAENNEWNQLYGIKKKDLNVRDLCWALVDILIELFRIVVSSLLVIFVPQNCGGTTCNIKENFEKLTDINKTAIGFNFITLGVLLLMYLVIYKREKFLIYRLDENAKLAKTNCSEVLSKHPEIEAGVVWYNRAMFYMAVMSAISYIINMLISGVVIFRDYYDGYQSVVQYLVNSGLCMYLIYRSIIHSRSNLVLSNTSFLPIAYNDVDQNYIQEKNVVEVPVQV